VRQGGSRKRERGVADKINFSGEGIRIRTDLDKETRGSRHEGFRSGWTLALEGAMERVYGG